MPESSYCPVKCEPKTFWELGVIMKISILVQLCSYSVQKLLELFWRILKEDPAQAPTFIPPPPPEQGYWQPHEFTTILKYWFSSGPQGEGSQSHAEFQTSVPVSSGFSIGVLCPHLIQLHLTEYRMLTLGGDLENI